jgi:hypothetical protein
MITPQGGWDAPTPVSEPEVKPLTGEITTGFANVGTAESRIARNVSIALTLVFFIGGLAHRPGSRGAFDAAWVGVFLVMLLSWMIFWRLRYGWLRMVVITVSVVTGIVILSRLHGSPPVVGQLVGFAMLVGLTFWVTQDAKKRGMSTRWGILVFLLAILFLPVYLWKRKPLGSRDSDVLSIV